MAEPQWIPHTRNVPVADLVSVSPDLDGTAVCVGRVQFRGNILPAKIRLAHNVCHLSYERKEHKLGKYEYLINSPRYKWVRSSDGRVVPHAVKGGRTTGGEDLYIGRAYHNGFLVPGKIQPSRGCLYIPYGNEEHVIRSYEILVNRPEPQVGMEPIASTPSESSQESRPVPREKFLDICAICLEEKPCRGIYVSCLHACLCLQCIDMALDRPDEHGNFKCPICRYPSDEIGIAY